jgi:hypothetical protein
VADADADVDDADDDDDESEDGASPDSVVDKDADETGGADEIVLTPSIQLDRVALFIVVDAIEFESLSSGWIGFEELRWRLKSGCKENDDDNDDVDKDEENRDRGVGVVARGEPCLDAVDATGILMAEEEDDDVDKADDDDDEDVDDDDEDEDD